MSSFGHKTWSRRRLLERLGLGAAAGALVPHLPWLEATAHAQAGPPSRLVIYVTENGTVPAQWKPGGSPGALTLDGRVLKALEKHRSKMVVITGLENTIHKLSRNGNQHVITHPQTLTCRPHNGGAGYTDSSGASIDQVVADAIGGATPFRSIQLGAGAEAGFSFKGPKSPDTPIASPQVALDRLFAGVPAGGGTSPPAGPSPRLTQRQRVLAAVAPQLRALSARLGREDRQRIEAHLTSLSELEEQLARLERGSVSSVGRPNLSIPSRSWGGRSSQGPALPFQVKIAAAALGANLTRVLVVHVGAGGEVGVNLGFVGHNQDAHAMAHSPGDPAKVEARTAHEVWKATQLAELLDLLDRYREGSGTALDNTLVAWTSTYAHGTHGLNDMPVVLAGSAGGRVKGNRLLGFPGRSTGDLFATLANAVGVPLTGFGDPRQVKGPLSGVVS
jgi:hypothetical protein